MSERGVTVVVIEEETAVREALGRQLRKQGFRVLTAADRTEAEGLRRSAPGVLWVMQDLRLRWAG